MWTSLKDTFVDKNNQVRETDRETERQRDRETERQREIERQ